MPHRIKHPPPPDGTPERRKQMRREEDVEKDEIASVIDEGPLVTKLLRTGRVAAAVGACCTIIGGVTGAMGYRMVGPKQDAIDLRREVMTRIDSNAARLARSDRQRDDLMAIVVDLRQNVNELRLVNCQMLRRLAPDLRPDGCQR